MNIEILHGKVIIDDTEFAKINDYHWYKSAFGYAVAFVNNKTVYMHRLILNYYGSKDIDHINRNKLDNRKENLRIVSRSCNMFNAKSQSNRKSKYKGVSYTKRDNSWVTYIQVNNVKIRLHTSKSEIECAYCYDCAIKILALLSLENNVDAFLTADKKIQLHDKVKTRLYWKGL